MLHEVFWYSQHPERARPAAPELTGTHAFDAVVVGGGIAGLTTAQLLHERGLSVALVERSFCGSGASGRSSGFITPDSELEAQQLLMRFGAGTARRLWRAAEQGCAHIRETIDQFSIDCEKIETTSAIVGTNRRGASTLKDEASARREIGIESEHFDDALRVVGGDWDGALTTSGTFSINAFLYCAALRDALIARGVRLFEQSPATKIAQHTVHTPKGRIDASLVFVCIDSSATKTSPDVYHAQTFLFVTEPLPGTTWNRIFPAGDLIVWDTDLVYQYFRRTIDDRLLAGGSLLRETYSKDASNPEPVVSHLRRYMTERLQLPVDVRIEAAWPGLIGVTKDFLPVAGVDPRFDSCFVAGAAAGLPWSVVAARTAVGIAVDGRSETEDYLRPERAFTDIDPLQPLLGKGTTFALAHYYTKNALRGEAGQVRRRRRRIGVAIGAFAIAALAISLLARRRD